MPRLDARPLAAVGILVVLLAGCSSDPVPTIQESGPLDALQSAWDGNVLSADRDAICAQEGQARMDAFRTTIEPWLAGLPDDRMPTEEDMTVFLADACPSTGVQTGDPSPLPSAPDSVRTDPPGEASPDASGLPTSQADQTPGGS
jgi:hypothetical protein